MLEAVGDHVTVGYKEFTEGDPLPTLREYRKLSPWNLRDLSSLCSAILECSGIRPINAAATARPNERTIRYYVTRGIVTRPDGSGTSATYHYRHLLQILFIKLRQMEGAALASIRDEVGELSGDSVERRVAASLGSALPAPRELPLLDDDHQPRGRSGRAFRKVLEPAAQHGEMQTESAGKWLRVPVCSGVELHVSEGHSLVVEGNDSHTIAEAVRLALNRLLTQ